MSYDNEYDYTEMLIKLQTKIKNFENPEGIEVNANIDPKFRDDFYQKMHSMTPRGILGLFESCGNMTNANHDFGKIDEKKIKSQLHKLKKMEHDIKKKIEKNEKNNNQF
jgi:hypothetical protein